MTGRAGLYQSIIVNRSAARTWLLSDGAFHSDRIVAEVTWVNSDDHPDVREGSTPFMEKWRVCMVHESGQGDPVGTEVVLRRHNHTGRSWTELESISNVYGTFELGSSSANLEQPIIPRFGTSFGDAWDTNASVLRTIASGLFYELIRLAGWKMCAASPAPVPADPGATCSVQFDNVRFQVWDPGKNGYADPNIFLMEVLAKEDWGLAHRMRSRMAHHWKTGAGKDVALRDRFHDLKRCGPPVGMTYHDAVEALVKAGLPLGVYPSIRMEVHDTKSGLHIPEKLCGTTSLLFDSCNDGDANAVRALIHCKADPLHEVEYKDDKMTLRSTPWIGALNSGVIEVVQILWDSATPSRQQAMLASFEERFVRISDKDREAQLARFPQSEQTRLFMASIQARIAIDQVLPQPASPAPD